MNAFERDLMPVRERRRKTPAVTTPEATGATQRAENLCAMYLRKIGARCRRAASVDFNGWRVCGACAEALTAAGFNESAGPGRPDGY